MINNLSLSAFFFKFLIKIVDLADGFFTHFVEFFLADGDGICPQTEIICGCIFASACEQQQYHHSCECSASFLIQLHL